MTIDMYGDKVAEASSLIREFAKVDYFHYFARDPESSLEAFIAMLDQAEEKGRQSQAARIAELGRALEAAQDEIAQVRADASRAAPSAPAVEQQPFKIESIDMPEFRKLADAYHCINEQDQVEPIYDAMVSFIDAEIERQVKAASAAPQAADTDKVREALEAIDRKAEAGLCQYTLGGIRAFHTDIRLIVKETLASMAAQAPVREVPGWQPIETAPKDGSQIMLTNGETVAQGWWEHQEPYIREQRDTEGAYIDQQEHDGFDGWLDCEGGMQPDPTHWQPLPALPAAPVQQDTDAAKATGTDGEHEPCGGCGNSDPDKRCIGCGHPFLAARQPAPVVAVKTWRERRDDALARDEFVGFDAQHMQAEIADLRAALAARSQP